MRNGGFGGDGASLNVLMCWSLLGFQSMQGGGLAYYNCGPSSGASQPHKHVQVVPLPLADGVKEFTPMFVILQQGREAQGASEGEVFEFKSFPVRSYGFLLPHR